MYVSVSLDIGTAESKTVTPYPRMSLSFDDDGYYWFCYPFFEKLYDRTGEMIDLYDGAWFVGAQLDVLMAVLEEISAAANTCPEQWEVCVGHAIGSMSAPTAPQPIQSTVRRDLLLSLLARFHDLVRRARDASQWIACLGD
jgi:hypothetical protein